MAEITTPLEFLALQTWDTYEAAHQDLVGAAERAGFAVRKQRSEDRNTAGIWTRYTYCCYKGGLKAQKFAKGQARRSRTASTVKTDCPFSCALVLRRDQLWHFKIVANRVSHNHDLDVNNAAAIANNRRERRRALDVASAIVAAAEAPGNPSAATITSVLRKENPNSPYEVHDIENIIIKHKRETMGGRSYTQQFLHELNGIPGATYTLFRHNDHPDGAIERIFWSYSECIERWRENPEILSIDCTYKVNRFNMPLCQISGSTGLNTTFPIAWCLLSSEKEPDFRWMLEQLKITAINNRGLTAVAVANRSAIVAEATAAAAEISGVDRPAAILAGQRAAAVPVGWVYEPYVIITDFDKALKNAITDAFPSIVQQQLCRWHIMKNVAFNVKKKWIGSLDGTVIGASGGGPGSADPREADPADEAEAAEAGDVDDNKHKSHPGRCPPGSERHYFDNADGIMCAFLDCVYAWTAMDFQANWQRLRTEFPTQKPIIEYIKKTYMPWDAEWAEYAVRLYRNFGIRSTSRTEGAHAVLKLQLQSRNADLHRLHSTILEVMGRALIKYQQRVRRESDQRLTTPPLVTIPLFRRLHGQISHFALKRVYGQFLKAKEIYGRDPIGVTLTACSEVLGAQFGLPCHHTIFSLLQHGGELELHHIDAHWWLHRDRPFSEDEIRQRNEPDPRVIARRRRNGHVAIASNLNASRGAILETIVVSQAPAPAPRLWMDNSVRRDPSHDERGARILRQLAPASSAPARYRD